MTLEEVQRKILDPALSFLPREMDSKKARVLLLAIGLQESEFIHRYQKVQGKPLAKGPARSFWQFEVGTAISRGGVTGVMLHLTSRYWLQQLCESHKVPFQAKAIWQAIETNDLLAAGLARLLIFTDAKKLPEIGDKAGAWELYAKRCWRPGKPHPESWDSNHGKAVTEVLTIHNGSAP